MEWLSQLAKNRMAVLLIAAAVDLLIGDPHRLWHPVQGIGAVIEASEKFLRAVFHLPDREEKSGEDAKSRPAAERIAGIFLTLTVLFVSTGLTGLFLKICGMANRYLGIAAEGILCGRLLALRSLAEAGFSVRNPLQRGETEEARRAVSMIVGRDTQRLDAEGIAKAAVETVAENTSDGVTAPLFYMILFGGMGGIFYKAVNTMDSMVGYKNSKYRYFGTAAARLDDVMNYLPSRLTALLMILACLLPGKEQVRVQTGLVRIPDAADAYRIWRRDRSKSPSPNSAQTESVCAGALHLRLLGDTWYFGRVHHKAEIGDGGRRVEPEDITRAVRLMERTAAEMFVTGLALLVLIAGIHPGISG